MPHLPSSYGAEGKKLRIGNGKKKSPPKDTLESRHGEGDDTFYFRSVYDRRVYLYISIFLSTFFLAVLLFARIIWETLLYLLLLPFSRPPPPPPPSHEDADSPGCAKAIRPIPRPSVNNETLCPHPRRKSDISGRREREEEESIRGDEKKKGEKE